MTFAIDISHWTGEVTAEQWACLRRVGVQKVIVGMQRHALAVRQIKGAGEAGLEVEAYVYIYFRGDERARVLSAVEALRGLPVQRLWIDAEDTTSGLPPSTIIHKLARALTATGPFATGIYTGRWWWAPYTGNTGTFRAMPLWDADYDGLANLHAFTPYGGWSQRAMKQYTNTTTLCGVTCDRDWYEESPPGLSPEWDMRQAFRVYAATNSGRAVVTELPEAGGFHRWTVTIPRNVT